MSTAKTRMTYEQNGVETEGVSTYESEDEERLLRRASEGAPRNDRIGGRPTARPTC